jgi:hypothetical protein
VQTTPHKEAMMLRASTINEGLLSTIIEGHTVA